MYLHSSKEQLKFLRSQRMALKLIVLTLLLLIPVCKSFNEIVAMEYNTTNLNTIPCIKKMFQKYFNSGQPMTGSALLVSIDPSYSLVQEFILRVLNKNEDYSWTVVMQNPKNVLPVASKEKVKNYLIFYDFAEDFEEVVEDWRSMSTWNPLGQLLVIFSAEIHPALLQANLRNIVRVLVNNKVFNANIVAPSYLESAVEVYTFYPYLKNSCFNDSGSYALADICEYDEEVDMVVSDKDNVLTITQPEDVYERFPENLHHCPLKVQAKAWEPYTVYDSKKGFVAGIDVMLVKTIAERLNLSAELTLQNSSTYQMYQQLIEHSIDMIIGGISQDPGLSDLLSSSHAYYEGDMTWCVHKAGPLLQWMSFLTFFSLSTWILIFLSLFISSTLIFMFNDLHKQGKGFYYTFLMTTSAVLAQPLKVATDRISVRAFCFFLFCFIHIISTAYQSLLISSLTHPQGIFQIQSVKEIVGNQMEVTGGIEILQHLNKKGKIYEYLQKKISICLDMEDCAREVIHDKRLAVAISRENAIYNPNIPSDKLFCFPQSENIYSYLVSILVPKDYHLLGKINYIVRQAIESGHIVKWTRDLMNTITLKEEIKNRQQEEEEVVLTLDQVKGPFILWTICTTISMAVFVIEVIVHRMVTMKESRFWNFLDNVLLARSESEEVITIKPFCN